MTRKDKIQKALASVYCAGGQTGRETPRSTEGNMSGSGQQESQNALCWASNGAGGLCGLPARHDERHEYPYNEDGPQPDVACRVHYVVGEGNRCIHCGEEVPNA